jgi:hypothetical protein
MLVMDKISYTIYLLLQDNNLIEIEKIISDIDEKEYIYHSGMISNMLLYYIRIKNDNKINKFLEYDLKKRDYLYICNYYYDTKGVDIFMNVYKKFDWDTKDIDYMIENKLYNVLYHLNNVYVDTSMLSNSEYHGEYSNNVEKDEIFDYLLCKNMDMKNEYSGKMYDIIIDGCNIIFSSKLYSPMELLLKYINLLKGYRILLVIHKRHIKKLNVKELNVDVCFTEYKMNDDLFILKYYCLFESLVLTNDEFYDHLHGMRKQTKKTLHNRCIRYNNGVINIPRYSKCIQVRNDKIYIPVKGLNKFYELNK